MQNVKTKNRNNKRTDSITDKKVQSNFLEYKGYIGSIEVNLEDGVLFGKVQGLSKVLLSYEGQTVNELYEDFKDRVEDYLQECEDEGTKPQKSFSGIFSVRVNPELHKIASILAGQRGMTLNKFMSIALQEKINSEV